MAYDTFILFYFQYALRIIDTFFFFFLRVSDKRGIFINEINLIVLSRWMHRKKERKKKNWKKEGKWKINSCTRIDRGIEPILK